MPLSFKSVGSKPTNPFSADPDPNTTPPTAGRIFEIPDVSEQGERSFGVRWYPEFTNPSGGGVTIDIVPWLFDEANGNWAQAVAETGITNYDMLVSPDFAPGRVFFQFIAQGGGTVDSVEIFAAAA